MMAKSLSVLSDSNICRLCAEDDEHGEIIFDSENNLSSTINRYLPLKVFDDGKFPRTICSGCNIQLESTIQFFELLFNGQQKLNEMLQEINEQSHKANTQSDYETVLASPVNDYSIHKMLDHQTYFQEDLYSEKHHLSLQLSLAKAKKKRGRPSKTINNGDTQKTVEQKRNDSVVPENNQNQELVGDRRKRKRNVPIRYMEAVQEQDLDKIFKEEEKVHVQNILIKPKYSSNKKSSEDFSNNDKEVIGHMETVKGEDLGKLFVISRDKIQSKSKIHHKKTNYDNESVSCIIHESSHLTVPSYKGSDCHVLCSNKEDLTSHLEVSAKDKFFKLRNIKITNNQNNMYLHERQGSVISMTLENNSIESEESIPKEYRNQFNSNKEKLLNALCIADGNNVFKCNRCKKYFKDSDNLSNHIKVAHRKEKPFVCEICHKGFAYQSSLSGHKEIVHQANNSDEGFPRDICEKKFNEAASIINHKLTEHYNSRLYVCNKCGSSFKHKQLLQRHQLVHSEDRPYPCKSCDASFKTKSNLQNHQATHTGEKKHFCELCDQKFAHKTSLTLHYRIHTGQKPYKCKFCSKSFSQNGNLQEHMRIHTGEKPYCCNYCERNFTTSSQFKLHVKRHTGERPWKCEHCEKSFLHKDTWKVHIRRHTGDRPFQCPECNRGFSEQWALTKHLRLHTGEKRYKCDLCAKSFADCSNLTKHKKIHKTHETSSSNTNESRNDALKSMHQIIHESYDYTEQSNNLQVFQLKINLKEDDNSIKNKRQQNIEVFTPDSSNSC